MVPQMALSPYLLWLSHIPLYDIFIHSSVDGGLGCLHVLAVVSSAVSERWSTCIFSDYDFLQIHVQD